MQFIKRAASTLLAVSLGALLAHLSQDLPWVGTHSFASLSSARAASRIEQRPELNDTQRSVSKTKAVSLNPIDLSIALGKPFARGKIMTGATPHRLILFTFDDGPDLRHTPALLDALDARGIKAVFFLSAWRIRGQSEAQRAQAEIAIETVRRGHMVASHGLDHLQLPLLNNEEALEQIVGAQAIFEKVFGQRPWLFRPPGGAYSDRTTALLADHGYTTVMWNLGTGDVQVDTPENVLQTWQRVLDRREREGNQNGGIILLHDTHTWSVIGFEMIHDELMRRNCKILKRGEELYDIVDDPRFFFSPLGKAAPTSKAAPAMPELALLEARQERLRKLTEKRCE
ncbi:MAG: polysaccharide deacetylase family protein [Myxococcales bacterium]|nr:MAG: polysaccharide deacetylase family protein [Myxococcales bacterium]